MCGPSANSTMAITYGTSSAKAGCVGALGNGVRIQRAFAGHGDPDEVSRKTLGTGFTRIKNVHPTRIATLDLEFMPFGRIPKRLGNFVWAGEGFVVVTHSFPLP